MHIKRKTISKLWPIALTGTKYMAVTGHDKGKAIPLIIVMRDVLKLVKTKKELKKVLNEKKILINNKIVTETNYPLSLFDSLEIPSVNKHFRVELKNRKYDFVEVSPKELLSRVFKVVNKKQLQKKKI